MENDRNVLTLMRNRKLATPSVPQVGKYRTSSSEMGNRPSSNRSPVVAFSMMTCAPSISVGSQPASPSIRRIAMCGLSAFAKHAISGFQRFINPQRK